MEKHNHLNNQEKWIFWVIYSNFSVQQWKHSFFIVINSFFYSGIESTLDDQTILDTIQNQVSKSEEELLADALLLEDLESSIPALEVSDILLCCDNRDLKRAFFFFFFLL